MKERFDGMVGDMLDGGIFLEQAIEVLEKGMIQGALDRHSGNQCAAARALGIHRNTLQRKMVAYELNGSRGRPRRKPAARSGHVKRKKAGVA